LDAGLSARLDALAPAQGDPFPELWVGLWDTSDSSDLHYAEGQWAKTWKRIGAPRPTAALAALTEG
jgi:hypothetical protein